VFVCVRAAAVLIQRVHERTGRQPARGGGIRQCVAFSVAHRYIRVFLQHGRLSGRDRREGLLAERRHPFDALAVRSHRHLLRCIPPHRDPAPPSHVLRPPLAGA